MDTGVGVGEKFGAGVGTGVVLCYLVHLLLLGTYFTKKIQLILIVNKYQSFLLMWREATD